ncbi:hypothetical protein GO730_20455 [Spirosoma sp. HMF3257]|uniref:T9SS type A sorting domain-containing protein n=1 Tax=Spirosoma telluris TaxID=2183553 RepID=A0A327NMI8_9BACT|nr:hypothetical protein [Spirosoma telluris]RAI75935.1 hypothetical protein HMF3257_20375 [Spirosoma telluris]
MLNTTGGNGTPIEYKVPGLGDWRTSPEFFVPTYQRDGMVFTLYIRQSGQEYTTQYTTHCNSGARQAASTFSEAENLQVRLLGNPVVNQKVIAEVTGVEGRPLTVKLTDMRGRILDQQQIEQAQTIERLVLPLTTESASLFLLEVATPSQHKTVRVLAK